METLPGEIIENIVKYLSLEDLFYFGLACKNNQKYYLKYYEICFLDLKTKKKILSYSDHYVMATRGKNKSYDFFGHLRYVNNKYFQKKCSILTLYEFINADIEDTYEEGGYFIFENNNNNKYLKYNDEIYIKSFPFEKNSYISLCNSNNNINNKYKKLCIFEKNKLSKWIIISPNNKKEFVSNHDKIILKNKHYNLYIGKLNDTKRLFNDINNDNNEDKSLYMNNTFINFKNSNNENINLIDYFEELSYIYKNMISVKLEDNLFFLTNFENCLVDNIKQATTFLLFNL